MVDGTFLHIHLLILSECCSQLFGPDTRIERMGLERCIGDIAHDVDAGFTLCVEADCP